MSHAYTQHYPAPQRRSRGAATPSDPLKQLGERFNMLKTFLKKYGANAKRYDLEASSELMAFFQKMHIRQQLVEAGFTKFDLSRRESRNLYRYVHPSEHVVAAISGRLNSGGFALLAATEQRILYLRLMPLFSSVNDIAYDAVDSISWTVNKWYATIVLHTLNADYNLSYITLDAARMFADYVDKKSMSMISAPTESSQPGLTTPTPAM